VKLREYPKYRLVGEGWPGRVPAEWECKRLKRAVALVNEKSGNIDGDLPYVGLENIESWTGRYIETAGDMADAVANLFTEGDVLFCKLRPYLAKALAPAFRGRCTSELLVLRPREMERRFLQYLCLSDAFVRIVDSSTFGAKMPRADWEFVGGMRVPYPCDRGEQCRIANFLDRETARIDGLSAKKKEMLRLLEEKRASLISHAVTRGLNPNAKVRDSGIPWVGKMPVGWEYLPLTKYMAHQADYRGKTPEKTPDGVFLVTTRNIRDGRIDYDASREFIGEQNYADVMSRGIPEVGDLLFTMEAPLGEVANVDKAHVALAQRIIKWRPKAGVFDPYFLKYSIMSGYFQCQVQSEATGSTAVGIKASKLHKLRVLHPPLDEQRSIVKHIDRVTGLIAAVSQRLVESIDLLRERRTALISAAVTGAIDVRSAEEGGSNERK
jgi:type I restriction enzyme S subunit